uniref:SHSP domain-containing protein n=1 Tax=Syphacia muris TaxID=451379 RepID=A0A0N5AN23_9BILA
MSTSYNRTSSYNRTYEKRIIGETPSSRLDSPLHLSSMQTPSLGTPLTGSSGFVTSQHSSEDSFYAQLDVSQFKPEDLKVSVVGQFVVVEAHHGEREDELGFIERHFIRKFRLPPSIRAEAVTSNLSADGQLSVSATAPKARNDGTARTVPITLISASSKAESVSSQAPPSTSGEFIS